MHHGMYVIAQKAHLAEIKIAYYSSNDHTKE